MKSFHCLGPGKLCINVGRQTWAFVLPPKEDFWTSLPFLCLWTMFTTETLGKELGKEQQQKGKKKKTLCKRLLTLKWNITMTKDFLAGLTVQWHPLLLLEPSLINKSGLNNGTYGNLLPAPKNLGLRPDTLQGPVMVLVTISFAVISHILYRLLSHFLLL